MNIYKLAKIDIHNTTILCLWQWLWGAHEGYMESYKVTVRYLIQTWTAHEVRMKLSCNLYEFHMKKSWQKSTCVFFSTSTLKYFIKKIHRHVFTNHETETHESLVASLFHGLSLNFKHSNLCWKSWLVHVHWNNKTCAWRSIYDWY